MDKVQVKKTVYTDTVLTSCLCTMEVVTNKRARHPSVTYVKEL